ncbi:hypothetical protein CSB96_0017 [Pseudomonas aeruginosa]|nr:hypothetical protein CSB96_0017 [Pseudomonas aeruginosa]
MQRDIQIINDTEGMYACNVGDTTNNWWAPGSSLWRTVDLRQGGLDSRRGFIKGAEAQVAVPNRGQP